MLFSVLLIYIIVRVPLCGYLWQMGDGYHLLALCAAHLSHETSHGIGYTAAHACVYLIEDDGGKCSPHAHECLQCQHHTRYLASAGCFGDGTGRAREELLMDGTQVLLGKEWK